MYTRDACFTQLCNPCIRENFHVIIEKNDITDVTGYISCYKLYIALIYVTGGLFVLPPSPPTASQRVNGYESECGKHRRIFFIKVLFYKLWIYLTCLSHADVVEFNVFTPGPIVTLKCLYKANFASRQNAEVKFTGDERLANESMQMPWRYGRNFPVKTSKMVSDVPSDNSILLRILQ